MESGATAIAYETVTAADGSLPLLMPMSEVAGRMSVQVAAACLQKNQGGPGILLGGVAGVPAAKVLVLGGGVAGTNAIEMAVGLRADVTVVDRSMKRLRELAAQFGSQIRTAYSTSEAIAQLAAQADVIIGSVLVPGAAAPKLITRAMLRQLKPGAVLVDIAIDQGGCFETSQPTTHSEPTYFIDGIQHYCVANMPGAVPRTSTLALTNATLPFVRELADRGIDAALAANPHLRAGLNVQAGRIVHPAVLQALGSGGARRAGGVSGPATAATRGCGDGPAAAAALRAATSMARWPSSTTAGAPADCHAACRSAAASRRSRRRHGAGARRAAPGARGRPGDTACIVASSRRRCGAIRNGERGVRRDGCVS